MKIGFIGPGRMGSAVAENLIKAGHELILYNRSREKAEALSKLGARVAGSIAKASAESKWSGRCSLMTEPWRRRRSEKAVSSPRLRPRRSISRPARSAWLCATG